MVAAWQNEPNSIEFIAENGAFVGCHDEILFSPALETKIVGTAGAGDAFGATLTAYLALGRRIDEAVSAATINSASVVEHVDTQTGLLRRHQLDQKAAATQGPFEDGPYSKRA
jgi:ribokinase